MKTTVTCDDVFDVLTRGPFPTGSSDDEAIEVHLTGCHDCRQLAEALKPAVELFHEVLEEKQSGLPEYRGRLADVPALSLPPPRVWWAEEQLLDLPAMRRANRAQQARGPLGMQPETAASLVRFASAALLGVALCFLVWTCSSIVGKQPGQERSLATYSAGPLRLGQRTTIALAALNMPKVCNTENKTFDGVNTADLADQACCTRCHAAAHPRGEQCQAAWTTTCEQCHLAGKPMRLATQHVSLTQQTCQVCHDG